MKTNTAFAFFVALILLPLMSFKTLSARHASTIITDTKYTYCSYVIRDFDKRICYVLVSDIFTYDGWRTNGKENKKKFAAIALDDYGLEVDASNSYFKLGQTYSDELDAKKDKNRNIESWKKDEITLSIVDSCHVDPRSCMLTHFFFPSVSVRA